MRLLATGHRGTPEGFQPPVSPGRNRSRLWRWSDIAAWAGIADEQARREATIIAAANAALEYRRLDPDSGVSATERLGSWSRLRA